MARATRTRAEEGQFSSSEERRDAAQNKVTDACCRHQVGTICLHRTQLGNPCHRKTLGYCVERDGLMNSFSVIKINLGKPRLVKTAPGKAVNLCLPSWPPLRSLCGPYPGNNYCSSSRPCTNSNNVASLESQHP